MQWLLMLLLLIASLPLHLWLVPLTTTLLLEQLLLMLLLLLYFAFLLD